MTRLLQRGLVGVLLKRQRVRSKPQPRNIFTDRRLGPAKQREMSELRRKLDKPQVGVRRGSGKFHAQHRRMLAAKLRELEEEDAKAKEEAKLRDEEERSGQITILDENPTAQEPVEEGPQRPKWLDDPSQTAYYTPDASGNPRMKTAREITQGKLNDRLAPLFGRDSRFR